MYDESGLNFDNRAHRIPSTLLKQNDLIVAICHVELLADMTCGGATFQLIADRIGLVHIARDATSGIVVDGVF